MSVSASESPFHPSGSDVIDRARRAVVADPTVGANFRERSILLYLWLGALQQQGANTRPFFLIDEGYYRLEPRIIRAGGEEKAELEAEMAALIDRGFGVVEEIQRVLSEEGPLYEAFEGRPEDGPTGGDPEAEWPMFQANVHNTGSTDAPGPKIGRRAWRVPVGLGWYARPAVEDGRVYLASLGMRTTGYCVDLESGEEIWASTQEHPLFGIYKYPAIASTPLIIGGQVVLREVNSHGGNEGQARNLVYLDKATGRTLGRRYAGHVDYRTRYAPVATNGEVVVYPHGIHDIYGYGPICQNFNRLICADRENEKRFWDFNVGDIDALAEPVVTADRVIVGTMEGILYSLNLEVEDRDERIAWDFKAGGPVNTMAAVEDGRVYFGCNGGWLYCLDESTGALVWQTRVDPVESRARKHFSTPTINGDRLFVGAANGRLYCLDRASGAILWAHRASDWVRARPVVTSAGVCFATVDGRLTCLDREGRPVWERQVSPHPIYADLVGAGDSVLVSDSNLLVYCLDAGGTERWRKSTLDAFEDASGQRIFTDVLSGGTYYQSKPTASNGKIYFGTPSGFLIAVEERTGKEVWKFEMGAAISVGPAIADGRVYAGQQGGERFFYCVDAEDGSLVWKQTVPGGWVWGSATVDDGLVYVPTVNGYAVCLDGKTGHIIWMFPTAMSIPAEPAVDGDLVYFGSWSRTLYAFDKKTGDVAWKASGVGLDSGTLIAYEGKIYLPNHRNIFSYLDAVTGKVLCNGNENEAEKGPFSNFNATPAFHDGRGYFTARCGVGFRGVPVHTNVYCVDAETAKIHWTFPDGGGLSAPAVAGGRVYVGSANSPFFYCLDEITGETRWIHRLGHRVEESTLCIYRDRVLVLAADGYLHSIE